MELKILYFGGKGDLGKVRSFLSKLLLEGKVLGVYAEETNHGTIIGYCILPPNTSSSLIDNIVDTLKGWLADSLFFVLHATSPESFKTHAQQLPQILKVLPLLLYLTFLNYKYFLSLF